MNKEELLELLKKKFDFLNERYSSSKDTFTLRGCFVNKDIELDVYLDFTYCKNQLEIYILDEYKSNKLANIPIENITEQKIDELSSQITKINTAFYMINHIAKGE